MLRVFIAGVLLSLFTTGCTTSDQYGEDGEVSTVKRFMGIPYMKSSRNTRTKIQQ